MNVTTRSYALSLLILMSSAAAWAKDLSTWKEGGARERIIQFVKDTTDKGGPKYIPPYRRIAVLDNDGTLWSEKPLPVELNFTLDRVKAMAPQHPEWKKQQPFKAVIEGDRAYFAKLPESERIRQALKLVAVSHSGMSVADFDSQVRQWFLSARDEKNNGLYIQRAYAPMLELLTYLRENEFTTYIVTGGDADFVRAISWQTYAIRDQEVVGSLFQTRWQFKNGKGELIRTSKIDEPVDNGPGKPVNIHRMIGKVPVLAVGNSDGDLEMMQYATSNSLPSLAVLIRHDDGARESAYDQGAEKVQAEAKRRNWLTVSMKNDFTQIFTDVHKQLGAQSSDH